MTNPVIVDDPRSPDKPLTDIEFVDAALLFTHPTDPAYSKIIDIGVKHKLIRRRKGVVVHMSAPDNTDFAAIKKEIQEIWKNEV